MAKLLVAPARSVSQSPASPTAVFLSYAREDTDAARRIADALRSHGVEVWFDQDELIGGDAWDRKIRQQIKECALFVPVISANTDARAEGYFRLEWLLAVERSRLMSEEKTFLIPVVVDRTTEANAKVPDKFRDVQWAKLPGGETPPAFVARVQKLLAGDVGRGLPTPPGLMSHAKTAGSGDPALQPKRSAFPWASAALAVVVLGLVAFIALRPAAKETPTAPVPAKPVAETKAAPVVPLAADQPASTDKSIAVLPFDNLSTDKGNGFFADGIHEDVLTALQNIRELRVISRTTVMQYREKTKPLPQIARELGVAYILQGSVRRAGNKVRVSAQLIDARTDAHVWALPPGERELNDIFALQSELAKAIAGALKTVLSPQEKKLLERRPTENLAAYDLYLKARVVKDRTRADLQNREAWLQAAVELDPIFALAWAELAKVHLEFKTVSFDTTAARLAKAKDAIDRATALAPDSPEVLRAVARYSTAGTGDYARATEQLQRLLRLQPNDTETRHALGLVQEGQGRWSETIASWRTVTLLDPGNTRYASDLVKTYLLVRRYDEAIAEQRRLVALQPGQLANAVPLAQLAFLATGSTREGEELLARLEASTPPPPEVVELRMQRALSRRDYAEFLRLDRDSPRANPDRGKQKGASSPDDYGATRAAEVLRAQGDLDGARARLGDYPARLRVDLEREPRNTQLLRSATIVEAILGNREEALRRIAQAAEIYPESTGSIGVSISGFRARVLALNGDKDRAIEEIARLLRIPSALNIHVLKVDPTYASLRGDPRFEALVNDPKNNAPLF